MPCIKVEVESFLTLGACASVTVVVPCVCYQATGSCSFASPNCSVTEDIIRFSKMGGHDGQPIPKFVGHLLHLLGHATEFKSLAISSLCLYMYNWEYKTSRLYYGSCKQGQLVLPQVHVNILHNICTLTYRVWLLSD